MIATIVFDLTIAILIGVAVALVLLVNMLSKIEVNYEKVDMSRISTTDSELKKRYSNACVVYITGPIIFANTKYIEQIPANVGQEIDTVLLSMRGVSHIDITGIQVLMDVLNEFRSRNVDFVICGLPNGVKDVIHKSGIYDLVGEDGFYWSVERVLFDKRPAKTF
jgi:SulP family sulfate permease